MSKPVTNQSVPGPTGLSRRASQGLATSSLLLGWLLASVLVHPLPHETSDRISAPLLVGADVPPPVGLVFTQACVNCHSEKTRWPWYSYVAPVSWLVENDVKHAREHINLSRWDNLPQVDQRMLLTAIATVIENHEMPPHRYVVLHPEAYLSAEDAVRVIEWTRAERRRLRSTEAKLSQK